MKIFYIDNRDYHHNRDIHIDFFASMLNHKQIKIIAYGKHLQKFIKGAITPGINPNKELKLIVERSKPNCIITYNCNGSSYELGLDNINLYTWCQDFLQNTRVPKFHISTDYCRSGFRQEQADWFKKLNYAAALFRHKISLKYPIEVPAYWFPFSVDEILYKKYSETNMKLKSKKVGFAGAAHNSAQSIYAHRIAAIDYLEKYDRLVLTKIVNKEKFERKIIMNKDYVKFLSQNLFDLTCGGTCNFMTAKYFQIPAAYSMLICTPTDGLEIFPENTYITYTKDSLPQLLEEIDYYSRNLKEAKFKIAKLNNYIINHHTHEQNISNLLNLIKLHI